MAVQTKVIKQKIASVKNIKKITKTMEMVSVSKMKKATGIVMGGKAYSTFTVELLSNIAGEKHISHPLMEENTNKEKELIIVISSNKGLCGSYNANISKALFKYKEASGMEVECLTIGKQSEKSAKRNKLPIVASFINLNERSRAADFLSIRDIIVEKFKNNEYAKVSVLYTEFINSASFKPNILKLIPVQEDIYKNVLLQQEDERQKSDSLAMYVLEPNATEILGTVLPSLIAHLLYHTFLESAASEHSARMFAMKNAGDNASGLLDDLILYFNQARQAAITQEISEIVGGVEAIN